jgi:hypothetical protein
MQLKKLKAQLRWFSLVLCILILTSNAHGQHRRKGIYSKNAAFAEISILKYQGIASVYYERTLYYSRRLSFTGAAGVGAYYSDTNTGEYYGCSVPVSLNAILGEENNHFEASLGARYTFGSNINKDISPFFPLFNLGYRYQQPRRKGFIFKVFVGTNGIGAAVGKAF